MGRIRPQGLDLPVPQSLPGKILFVGEAPGEQEEALGLPFVGASGQLLTTLLKEVGIPRSEVALTNVFLDRPPANTLASWCHKKAIANELADEAGWPSYHLPPLAGTGNYLEPYRALELFRLREEIRRFDPNLIVALGGTALWALCGRTGITKYRGAIVESELVPGYKVLPTFHPASVLRKWDQRVVVLGDLAKALRQCAFPEIRYPSRSIYVDPTLDDLAWFYHDRVLKASHLGVDLETVANRFISCVGFASSPTEAMVIPFIYGKKPHYRMYWSPEAEPEAWHYVYLIATSPAIKVLQNGPYDVQYFAKYGIPLLNYSEDTMFRHHAAYPELPKDLGFLGSAYTDERSWKVLRPRKQEHKKDD